MTTSAATDLTTEQRARLEALEEAKRLTAGYQQPIDVTLIERLAVFILDGAEHAHD